jgi:hypothetical protein
LESRKKIILIVSQLLMGAVLFAQGKLIVVQGLITTSTQNPIAATVAVQQANSSTMANVTGRYSIVAKEGQQLLFSYLGMKNKKVRLPDSIRGTTYTLMITLDSLEDTLAEVVVGPWLNRDNLSANFLAMPSTREDVLNEIADNNMSEEWLLELGEFLEHNAMDNTKKVLDQRISKCEEQGQLPPMNLFSPLAWSEVFRKKKWNRKTELTDKEKRLLDIMENESP